MNELASISEKIGSLWHLRSKETIFLEDLRKEFRRDLQAFIVGQTLSMKDGKIVIGHNLYKKWLEKLKVSGFDYEIDFKQ